MLFQYIRHIMLILTENFFDKVNSFNIMVNNAEVTIGDINATESEKRTLISHFMEN